jgi:hypothetical protein
MGAGLRAAAGDGFAKSKVGVAAACGEFADSMPADLDLTAGVEDTQAAGTAQGMEGPPSI